MSSSNPTAQHSRTDRNWSRSRSPRNHYRHEERHCSPDRKSSVLLDSRSRRGAYDEDDYKSRNNEHYKNHFRREECDRSYRDSPNPLTRAEYRSDSTRYRGDRRRRSRSRSRDRYRDRRRSEDSSSRKRVRDVRRNHERIDHGTSTVNRAGVQQVNTKSVPLQPEASRVELQSIHAILKKSKKGIQELKQEVTQSMWDGGASHLSHDIQLVEVALTSVLVQLQQLTSRDSSQETEKEVQGLESTARSMAAELATIARSI